MQPTPSTIKPLQEASEAEFAPFGTPDRSLDAFRLSEPGSGDSTIADWVAAAKLANSKGSS